VKSRFSLFVAASSLFLALSCGRNPKVSGRSQSVERLCFMGDVMLARGVKGKIDKNGKEFLFERIKPILEQYKYRFINLECPITALSYPPDKPYSFRADSNFVGILTSAGITHATLANNHIDDQKIAGANDTYRILKGNGITPLGLKSKQDTICEPAEILVGGRRIAVFSALGIEMNCSNIWYCGDSAFQSSLGVYKKNNPSAFVVCYLHWGIEYFRHPSREQKRIARELIGAGADMIIGHHPHVIESIEHYKGKLILYSLGNLVFDQHDPESKEGIIAGLTVMDTCIDVNVIPYDIREDRPVPLRPEEKEEFKKSLLSISDGISLQDDGIGWEVKEKRSDRFAATDSAERTSGDLSTIKIKDRFFDGTVKLVKLTGLQGYKLKLTDVKANLTDDLYVPYPVYRFSIADVNNDGRTDILLGVIKSTHFDPIVGRRLFIYRIDSSRLSPLWLGSRVCLSLVDFKPAVRRGKSRIMTVEKDQRGLYRNGLYQWDNFGLKLIEYKNENSNESFAYAYFNNKK
jgi:poly-gamma-glutamate capsule biosynthesis protein CapA/YwtB (metallophosphatase superfamily)